jgi:phospholipid/cholesterol/gamma-HCH transport system substrate-binding protein
LATKKQKVKVGIFVLGCAALIVGGIMLILGFRQGDKTEYWLEFEESVLGLSVGNTVEYLGVPVGTVDDISILSNNHARVDITIRNDKVTLHEGVSATLVMFSFATGTMYISLAGGEPDAPPLTPWAQIPTQPSLVEAFRTQVESLLANMSDITAKLNLSLEGMPAGQLTSVIDDAQGLLQESREFVQATNVTLQELQEKVSPAIEDFGAMAKNLRGSTEKLNGFLDSAKGKMEPLDIKKTQDELNRVLTNAADLTEKMKSTVEVLDTASKAILYDEDNIQRQIKESLQIMTETMESIRDLADYLKQDPASLIRGKGEAKGEK